MPLTAELYPKTKEQWFQLPLPERIAVKQSLADQYMINDFSGDWTPDIETGLMAYHQKGFKQPASDKILNNAKTAEVNNPGISNVFAKADEPNAKAKEYAAQGKNPVMAYLEQLTPEYDKDKEKRLKNLALINGIGGLLTSVVNVAGAKRGSVIAPQESQTLPYVANSLKEMHDNRQKLTEGYKGLTLQELIRQQNQADQERNMDMRWEKMRGESDREYQNRIKLMQMQLEAGKEQRDYDFAEKKDLATFQHGLQKDLIQTQTNKEMAVDEQRYNLMGEMYDKKLKTTLDKEAAKYSRDEYKTGLTLTDPNGTPYPRPLKNNELPLIYTIIAQKYPDEAPINLKMMDEKFDQNTKMKVLIATYMYDPEIRAAVEKILAGGTSTEPMPQNVLDSLKVNSGLPVSSPGSFWEN